ncbi:hypothetical protein EBU94_06940, partial [bacterium]|nr:hypothetical protein [bacterium]
MRKHIIIFEAFKSTKLSRVLSYIGDEKSRKEFLSQLEFISGIFDFPMSEISDDMMLYSRFQKAIELNTGQEGKEWIKFWFDEKGKLICTTLTDGIKRPSDLTVNSLDEKNLVVDKVVPYDDLIHIGRSDSQLNHLDVIKI